MKKILFILLVATSCGLQPYDFPNAKYITVVEENPNLRPGQGLRTYHIRKDTLVFGSLPFVLSNAHFKEFETRHYNFCGNFSDDIVLFDAVINKYEPCYKYHDDEFAEILDKAFELCGKTTYHHVPYWSIAKDKDGNDKIAGEYYSAPYLFDNDINIILYGTCGIDILPKAAIEKAKPLVAQEKAEKQAQYNRIYNSL